MARQVLVTKLEDKSAFMIIYVWVDNIKMDLAKMGWEFGDNVTPNNVWGWVLLNVVMKVVFHERRCLDELRKCQLKKLDSVLCGNTIVT
jgi:hypothetical protein